MGMVEISAGDHKTFQDLNPLFAGYEQCEKGHVFGPAIREYYLIHHVLSGKGTYTVEGKTYHLSKGGTFLIKPGQLTVYQADEESPWFYVWIGFSGKLARELDPLPPVLKVAPGVFHEIKGAEEISACRKEYLTAALFRLYCELFQGSRREKDYAREVHDYITYNYMSDITVDGLAQMMSLDRRYLSRLFKSRYGMPVKKYLVEYRMEKAAEFLQKEIPVSRAAEMVGYRDVCNFSKMFRKVRGVSPGQYSGRS